MTWAVKVDYEKKAKALEAKGAELEARIAQLETENSELKSEAAAASYKIMSLMYSLRPPSMAPVEILTRHCGRLVPLPIETLETRVGGGVVAYVDTSVIFGAGSRFPIWGGSIGSSPFAPIYNSPFFPSKSPPPPFYGKGLNEMVSDLQASWNASDLVKKPDG